MCEERINKLEERIEMLEFKVQLLSENSNISRLLFEYYINQRQYSKLMDLMDEFRDIIERGEKVSHVDFEQRVYEIIHKNGDYHFCESLAQSFMEDGRWEVVFPSLYGDMAKYKYYMEKRIKGGK